MRLLLRFSLPMLVGNIFQQFYSMVDAMIVGRFVGVDALAAVGATGGSRSWCWALSSGLPTGSAWWCHSASARGTRPGYAGAWP